MIPHGFLKKLDIFVHQFPKRNKLTMSFFVLDTSGDKELLERKSIRSVPHIKKNSILDLKPKDKLKDIISHHNADEEADEAGSDDDYFGLPPPNVNIRNIIDETLATQTILNKGTKSDNDIAYVKASVEAAARNAEDIPKRRNYKRLIYIDHSDYNPATKSYDTDGKLTKVDVTKELSSTKMTAGLEQQKGIPVLGHMKKKKLNRLERAKTKGSNWYGLPAQELTEEVQNDLKILQMRSALDPKHFYKKNDLKVLPKYFQVGTVLHSPLDHYQERDTRRNKKKSLVDELMEDANFQKFNKRKYKEIMSRRDYYSRRKALKKLKKLKK